MSEHVQRLPTGTDWIIISAIGLAALLLAAFAAGGQTDGSREPTCIVVQESDLPGAFEHPRFTDCVQPAATWHDAKMIETHPPTFRHFFWHSGPTAAIFQVDVVETDGGPRHWANPSGCRTITAANTVESGHAGAYWAMGYNIVVASGQSCAAYGVPECTGGLCR